MALVPSGAPRIERIAGHEREPRRPFLLCYPYFAPVLGEESEVGVPVPADHAVSRFARERRAGNMPGAESHGCAVCAAKHVPLDAEARHAQPGDGPGIGPRPGLCLALAAQGPCPGVRDETVRQPCLGLNPCSTPQLPRA